MHFLFLIVLLTTSVVCEKKDKCETCKGMAEKFREGMERTLAHNYGGGNTDWEETRLGSYANSETRLVDIMEKICSSTECHSMVEEYEEDIETWWFKEKSKGTELESWFCVDTIEACCPKGKFGSSCEACPGGVENPCGDRGHCKGDGTRSGSGECDCDEGYSGTLCDECDEGYFQDHNDTAKLNCLECHESCDGACTDGTPKGCETCKDGWEDNEDEGCVDKNECELSDVCGPKTFCVNSPGSFKCQACDVSCAENCTEGGAKGCLACADGYEMTENDGCKDKDECSEGASCEDGKYCKNTPGSYECVGCNLACSKCTGAGSQKCSECNKGYDMTDTGCEDKDECSEEVTCPDGKHCSNIPGSFECVACHEACAKCTGRGSDKCTECNPGYENTDHGCEDVDECKSQTNLCPANEKCKNTVGSYTCKCIKGFKRKGGQCVIKKAKKKKSGKKTGEDDDEQLAEELREEQKTRPTSKEDDVTKSAGPGGDNDVTDDETSVFDDGNDDDTDLDNLMREEL